MINVTNRAAEQLRALVGAAAEKGLRIAIAKGGCSGLQYEMSLGEVRSGDLVV
jgi:Fe-S cluster assembly iron-binding protein IscA